jgi:hypothetical protein
VVENNRAISAAKVSRSRWIGLPALAAGRMHVMMKIKNVQIKKYFETELPDVSCLAHS